MALYLTDGNGVPHKVAGNPKEQELPLNYFYTKAQTVDFTSMTQLYYTTSVSTGTKTLSDSLENYKLLIIGFYNNNSACWTFQNIPRVLFDTLNSSSNMLSMVQSTTAQDRRMFIYKYSNTQVYLYNVDNAHRVAIYGLK